jgi:hypothetical protein
MSTGTVKQDLRKRAQKTMRRRAEVKAIEDWVGGLDAAQTAAAIAEWTDKRAKWQLAAESADGQRAGVTLPSIRAGIAHADMVLAALREHELGLDAVGAKGVKASAPLYSRAQAERELAARRDELAALQDARAEFESATGSTSHVFGDAIRTCELAIAQLMVDLAKDDWQTRPGGAR